MMLKLLNRRIRDPHVWRCGRRGAAGLLSIPIRWYVANIEEFLYGKARSEESCGGRPSESYRETETPSAPTHWWANGPAEIRRLSPRNRRGVLGTHGGFRGGRLGPTVRPAGQGRCVIASAR